MNAQGPTEPLAVEVERSGVVESVHLVDVAVCDDAGRRVASAGNAGAVAYLRSSAKPVQAAVCLDAGWSPGDDRQIAIACASHNGEPPHLEAVRSILHDAGLGEESLRCPPARPLVPSSVEPAPVYHNCSGKHAAMLATNRAKGWSLDDYRDPDHPLQRSIAGRVAVLAGTPPDAVGIDGCGVPTFAMSLSSAATLFARLPAEAPRVADAMLADPFLVGGTDRLCTALMDATGTVVLKIGAEGIACAAIPEERIGVALKTRDGTQRGRDVAVIGILELLGVLSEPVAPALAPFAHPSVLGGGVSVGSVRWRGTLRRG